MMEKQKSAPETATSLVFSGVFVLAVLGVLIVWLGVYPTWLINLVNSMSLSPF
jgi:NADH:ubiquinone oxidoreductase subunit 4 (subunit M)